MVKTKKNKRAALGEQISNYRKMLNITQEELIDRAKKKYLLKIGLRNLQNAEASKEVAVDTLTSLAYFFSNEGKIHDPSTIITIDSISEDPNKKTSINLNIPNIIKKNNLKAFAANIKKDRTFKTETTYLQRIDFHDQIIQAIRKSKKRKIFYPFNPDLKEVSIIKKTLTEINQIHDSIFGNKFDFSGNEYDTDSYHELDKEIQSLTKISDFGESIKELKKNNLNLYVGNFDFSYITSEPVDPSSIEEEDVGDPSGFHYRGWYRASIETENYALFSFQKSNITSFTFNYDNEWFKEKILKIIEIDTYKEDNIDYEAHSNIMQHYQFNYGYYNKFQKLKASLTQTDLTELLTADEREKIGQEYEMEKAEDYAAQQMSDLMRGK